MAMAPGAASIIAPMSILYAPRMARVREVFIKQSKVSGVKTSIFSLVDATIASFFSGFQIVDDGGVELRTNIDLPPVNQLFGVF